jgi:hypothetical protein
MHPEEVVPEDVAASGSVLLWYHVRGKRAYVVVLKSY